MPDWTLRYDLLALALAFERILERQSDNMSDYLEQLIETLDKLLQNEKIREKFKHHFEKFCGMVETHIQELKKYEEIVKKELDRLPEEDEEAKNLLVKMQSEQLLVDKIEIWNQITRRYNLLHNKPPYDHPEWVLGGIDYYVQHEELTLGLYVWHPPLKQILVNPVLWFFSEMDKYLSDKEQIKKPDDKEILMCDFVRLAVIHDESCEYNKSIMIYRNKDYNGRFKRDDFVKDLWESYRNPAKDNFKKTHERLLKQALEHVKAEVIQGINGNKKKLESKKGEKTKVNMLNMQVRSSKDNWENIKREYGISKKDFGKKINFVSDLFKRKIIFRDVEHAFLLASEGFAKPAVILAGGVIEELLRLYLKHKNIAAADNTFNEYIKACEQNKLLQKGIGKLSDSAREFRNFVHLSKESTKKHSITKAAAKGAVSSIFTIANDF